MSEPESPTPSAELPGERIGVVRAFADAITKRDLGAALDLCHPEIEFFSTMSQLEASPFRGFSCIRRYFKEIDASWEEWRVEVEQLLAMPDGRVVIVMSTHLRGKGSGLPFVQRVRKHLGVQGGEALARDAVPGSRRRNAGDQLIAPPCRPLATQPSSSPSERARLRAGTGS